MTLCTVDQVKQRLGMPASDSRDDDVLATIVAGVSGRMAGAEGCGRPLEQQTLVQTYSPDTTDCRVLWTRVWPIVSVSELLERYTPLVAWGNAETLTEDTDFEVDAERGGLLRLGLPWSRGDRTVRVTCTAGYVPPSTSEADGWGGLSAGEVLLPGDLVEAAIAQAVNDFQRRRNPGATGQSAAGGNVSWQTPEGLLPGVRDVCGRYRRLMG